MEQLSGGTRLAPAVSWPQGLLAASVLWAWRFDQGLRQAPRPNWLLDLHQWLGTLTMIFLGVHVAGLMLDSYVDFGLTDVLVPFARAGTRPRWPGASWPSTSAARRGLTALGRRYLPKVWRSVHYLSFPVFVLATIHGVAASTDATTTFAVATVVVVVAMVAMLSFVRLDQAARQAKSTPPRPPTPGSPGRHGRRPPCRVVPAGAACPARHVPPAGAVRDPSRRRPVRPPPRWWRRAAPPPRPPAAPAVPPVAPPAPPVARPRLPCGRRRPPPSGPRPRSAHAAGGGGAPPPEGTGPDAPLAPSAHRSHRPATGGPAAAASPVVVH